MTKQWKFKVPPDVEGADLQLLEQCELDSLTYVSREGRLRKYHLREVAYNRS